MNFVESSRTEDVLSQCIQADSYIMAYGGVM